MLTQTYALGLVFSEDKERVLLLKKKRPAWCESMLSSVGGKMEETDESVIHAMSREFCEETGVPTAPDDWKRFIVLRCERRRYAMHFFKMFNDEVLRKVKSVTDEPLFIYSKPELKTMAVASRLIPSLHWIIPMAVDTSLSGVVNVYEERADWSR